MPSAGELRHRVRFEQRAVDGNGDRLGGWAEHATVSAKLLFLRGSEPVLASRLQGVQPVVVTVRASSQTRPVTTAFRIVNARSGEVYEIKAVTPDGSGAWIDFLCEGRADG